MVEFLAGVEHDIEILDMHDAGGAVAAASYGIRRQPAVVVDGRLADCSAGRGLDEETLTREIFGGHGGAGA
jgi:glutaredoxin 3